MSKQETPDALGYRWPAEWEPHASTWLAWPHNQNTWPGKFEPVPPIFADFVRTLAAHETVNVLAGANAVWEQARSMVGDVPNVVLHAISTNDSWCRDHGPTFLVGEGLPKALIDWGYNAWGGKYPPFDLDNAVPRRIAELQHRRRFIPGIILEGGAIDGNGQGTVLTTESCLMNPNRNPGLAKSDIERHLAENLGAKKVLWLSGDSMEGDDTDGHIDQLARFVGPRTVVAMLEANEKDPNFAPLRHDFALLEQMTDQDGQPLEVIPLPMPRARYYNGQRLPCGYCNFYIANGVVVVPVFGDPADEVALTTLARVFPDREMKPIPALDLVWGLGAFHCLSQQEPKT